MKNREELVERHTIHWYRILECRKGEELWGDQEEIGLVKTTRDRIGRVVRALKAKPGNDIYACEIYDKEKNPPEFLGEEFFQN